MIPDLEHEMLRREIKAVLLQSEANFDQMAVKLNSIEKNSLDTLTEAKKTNGRVTTLEKQISEKADKKEIEFFVLLKNRKWLMVILIFAGLYVYDKIPNIETIIKWITTLF